MSILLHVYIDKQQESETCSPQNPCLVRACFKGTNLGLLSNWEAEQEEFTVELYLYQRLH